MQNHGNGLKLTQFCQATARRRMTPVLPDSESNSAWSDVRSQKMQVRRPYAGCTGVPGWEVENTQFLPARPLQKRAIAVFACFFELNGTKPTAVKPNCCGQHLKTFKTTAADKHSGTAIKTKPFSRALLTMAGTAYCR